MYISEMEMAHTEQLQNIDDVDAYRNVPDDIRCETEMVIGQMPKWEDLLRCVTTCICLLCELIVLSMTTGFTFEKNPPTHENKLIKWPTLFRESLSQVGWSLNDSQNTVVLIVVYLCIKCVTLYIETIQNRNESDILSFTTIGLFGVTLGHDHIFEKCNVHHDTWHFCFLLQKVQTTSLKLLHLIDMQSDLYLKTDRDIILPAQSVERRKGSPKVRISSYGTTAHFSHPVIIAKQTLFLFYFVTNIN